MEIDHLTRKNDRIFILVCLNFVMLAVLFIGLAYVLWQSATITNKLKSDLAKAELAMSELKERFQLMDMDAALERVMTNSASQIKSSVNTALTQGDLGGRLDAAVNKVDKTTQKLEAAGRAVAEANERLGGIDSEQLARMVSYNILKGLGEGFTSAAESRKPR